MTLIACDPGLTGAFCFTDGKRIDIRDMPVRNAYVNGKERRVIDEDRVFQLLQQGRDYASTLLIEQVNGMPGQSGPAAFTFGYGVGVVTGVAYALDYQVERVAPARWKGALGVPSDKNVAREMAKAAWPEAALMFSRKKDDGRAEAALIAKYGIQVYGDLK